MNNFPLPDFLPGRFALARGTSADYRALAGFHYAGGPPATWAGVWVIRFAPGRPVEDATSSAARTVAVGVLSYPVPSCRARQRWFGLDRSRRANLAFANARLRTISRVIVHPQFRALGLSRALVRCLCARCETRYVEAIAQMGAVHPLFTRAGMTRTNADHPEESAYFVFDRHAPHDRAPRPARG